MSSPWGANEAELDQMTDRHKKELALMHETHVVKKDIFDKNHATRFVIVTVIRYRTALLIIPRVCCPSYYSCVVSSILRL